MTLELEFLSYLDVDGDEEITQTDEPISYLIKRTRVYTTEFRKVVSRESCKLIKTSKYGNPITFDSEAAIKSIIETILPKDLSKYFFYWGEKIEDIGKAELNKAIQTFAGLDVYTSGIKHLNKVLKFYNKDSGDSAAGDEIARINTQIEAKNQELAGIKDQIRLVENELFIASERVDKANEDYYKIENDIKLKEEMERATKKEEAIKESLKTKNENFIRDFDNSILPKILVIEKAKEALALMESDEATKNGWSNVSVQTINEIIEKGTCICGRKISDHPEIVQILNDQKKYALPNALGGVVKTFKNTLEPLDEDRNSYLKRLQRDFDLITESQDMLQEVRREKQNIVASEVTPEEIETRKAKKISAEGQKSALEKQKGAWEMRKRQTEQVISNLEKEREQQQKFYLRQSKLLRKINVTEYLIKSLEIEKSNQEQELRKKLIDYTQKYFDQIYVGEAEIVIGKNFDLTVVTKINSARRINDTSPGLEVVKNFAFVAALIQIAKEQIEKEVSEKTGRPLVSEPYPLVLDAPFSQADTQHIRNLGKLLAKIQDQAIFAVMEKDWEVAKEELSPYVGIYYRIHKEKEYKARIMKESLS